MHTNRILSADLLDLLFEGRNKEYGAYQLRKNYNKRLLMAIAGTLLATAAIVCFFLLPFQREIQKDLRSTYCTLPNELIHIIIPEPPQPERQKKVMKTSKFNTPVIVADDLINKRDRMATQDDLQTSRIDNLFQEGELDKGMAGPPSGIPGNDGNSQVTEAGIQDNDQGFIPIEMESEYPGGRKAWMRFLNKTLSSYPSEAYEKGVQGTVVIQFIVDATGTVSDIRAISGPEELREAAVNTIRKSGKWKPALQNGRNVRSYKKQPITFLLTSLTDEQ